MEHIFTTLAQYGVINVTLAIMESLNTVMQVN